jgi:hypothetical protein
MFSKLKRDGPRRCSFCGKPEDQAGELIASPLNDSVQGPPCYICFACVGACKTIVDDNPHTVPVERGSPPAGRVNWDRSTNVRYSVRFGPLPRLFSVTTDD